MDELRTTPYNFIWKVKNPQNYWADSFKDIKYNVYVNSKKLGGFCGVNMSFDDDMYYVNFYDEDNHMSSYLFPKDTEMILKLTN